jgi:hypothetical protein
VHAGVVSALQSSASIHSGSAASAKQRVPLHGHRKPDAAELATSQSYHDFQSCCATLLR